MCQICKLFLKGKALSLGETANKAVHNFDPSACNDSDLSDEDEGDDNDTETVEDTINTQDDSSDTSQQSIVALLSRVNSWCKLAGPRR